jgi:signal transduction histidine kinase
LIEDVVARVWPLVARARVEQALRASEERARQKAEEALSASRAKDDFLAALSHELRTPLTPVLMTVSALEEEPDLDPIIREDIAMIKRNVQLEARLIDDLLDLTRITHGKFQILRAPVDLHALLTQTEDIARADGLGKSVHMEYRMRAERSRVLADGTRLLQVLWNLLKNALKFTPAGGKVTISTRNEDKDFVVVEVVDTGVGIRAEVLPHVFNAFEQGDQRGKHRYGGLGLGRAISKAIVDAHGGTLTAASEGTGRGATFTLRLPVEE